MAQEHGAINLSQGFPGFESDTHLISLVDEAMKAGHNQYAPMQGDAALRQRITEKIKAQYNKAYNWESEVTITSGATQAIFTAIAAMIREGDEVILFTPAYDCYEPAIELFGGIPVHIQLRPPGYGIDWQEVMDKITSRTRMIMINSPHNPTGTLASRQDMLQLEALALKHDLWVISDEVYEHIIFDGEVHHSAARFEALAARTFITASFGKTFHNTGWKMGYCVAPEPLMKEFQKVHQYNVFSVNHPMQKALAIYMQNAETYLGLADFYQKKRDYFLSHIKDSRFTWIPASGTYFQLLDYSAITSEGDVAFAERLTRENGLATIPTSVFNPGGEDFKQLRVCFAKTEETLEKAAHILNTI